MTRLLLEDVTVLRADTIILQIRFKGGAARTLTLPLPPNAWQQRATSPEVVRDIDQLLEHNTDGQIATILNERGTRSGEGKSFSRTIVARIRRDYSLTPRYPQRSPQIRPMMVRSKPANGAAGTAPLLASSSAVFKTAARN